MCPDEMNCGEIIQCHIDHNDKDTFVVGKLLAFNRDWFLLDLISPLAQWDGLGLFLQSDLVYIERNTRYIDKLTMLLPYSHTEPMDIMIPNENLLNSVLSVAKESKKMIALELYYSGDREPVGFVEEITNDTVSILQVDEFADFDGTSIIDMSAITRCIFEDHEMRNRRILYEIMKCKH